MSTLDPEIKKRWVAALRSGEYAQTQERLKRAGGGYCCLGVLCDLFAKEAGIPHWTSKTLSDKAERHMAKSGFGYAQLPGARIAIWSGFSAKTPVTIDGKLQELYRHNDAGVSFTKIADAIEQQL